MEILQLLSTLSEDYPGLNEEIITSACLVVYKVSVCDDYIAPWGWPLLHGAPWGWHTWGWLLLYGGGYCSMEMAGG